MPSITEISRAGSFGLRLPKLPSNPFVGLRPFNSDEALLYFGRHEQTIELLRQLHRTHFVALVGSSGCGKSSLVYAGLIPKLEAGFLVEERDQWLIARMKPGDDPLKNLAATLLPHSTMEPTSLNAAISEGDFAAILESLTSALTKSDANLLLLIDQFEELFRFGLESGKPGNRVEAARFVELMLALSEQRQLPIYVVMTMRSDFIGDCDNFHGFPEALNRSQYLVPRLTDKQLRQAIEGPIHLFGGQITPRLLDRVLNDVGDKSDQLPVMQHALMRTWEQWSRDSEMGGRGDGETDGRGDGETERASENRNPQSAIRNPQSKNPQSKSPQSVDVPHYEAVGTLTEALSRDAEAALESLSEEGQKIAERMFQALTDTDARNRQIRRPAHLSELCAITGASRETLDAIIEEFSGSGRSFLTATKEFDPLIDISHESLIRQWRQMSDWVNAETEWRDRYKRLSHDAEIHRQSGKSEDLLKGSQLASALEWQEKRNPNHAWARRYRPNLETKESDELFNLAIDYLSNSNQTNQREIIEASKRRKRSQRIAWSVTSVILLLLLSLLVIGLFAIKQDTKYRSEIYQSDIKTASEEFIKGHYSRTMDLLVRHSPDQLSFFQKDLRDDLWQTLWQLMHDEIATLRGHEDSVFSIAVSPDGSTLASASADNMVKFWDTASRQNIATFKGHEDFVLSVVFAPGGKTLASASLDKTIKLWDAHSGQLLNTLKGYEDSVRSVASVASPSSPPRRALKSHERAVFSVAFAPDGKTLASASDDKTVKLWDARSGQNIATLKGHDDSVWSVAFAPDGKTLASASGDKTVKLWDARSGQLLTTLKGHEASVRSVAFAPDGKTLASASLDMTVKLWDGRSRQSLTTLKGHEAIVNSVAFAPDGKTLASASDDKTVKLWDARSGQNIATLKGHESSVWSVAFAPDGKTLASAGGDEKDFSIRLWRAATDADVERQRKR